MLFDVGSHHHLVNPLTLFFFITNNLFPRGIFVLNTNKNVLPQATTNFKAGNLKHYD